MATQPRSLFGLEPEYTAYSRARFAVLPIPYEATVTYMPGTCHGPNAILTASEQVELFDEELRAEFHQCGIHTLAPLEPGRSDPAAVESLIFEAASRVLRDGKFLLALGGEHGITAGLVRAAAAVHEKLSVLQIDAHLDLRESYGGTPYSHACVMRRVRDHVATIVPVGIRNIAQEEHQFLQTSGLVPITARECFESDHWVDRAVDALTQTVYVTIDIDGFDPAYAPGTGTPEPGGLDWYQVTSLLRRVAAEKTIVGADIVEVMPIPGQAVTEFLAARLAYKLVCYVQQKARRDG
jgi:agmatinase